MLGQTLMKRLPIYPGLNGAAVIGVDLAEADLTEPSQVTDLFQRIQPDWVIHCAAWTDVDGAESHREAAMKINGLATELVAAACNQCNAGLSYISTDYVFNGQGGALGYSEDAFRDPINFYGLSKARGEEAVEAMQSPWQIVRTSWLFGDGLSNFPKTMFRLLSEKPCLKVVNDQRGCPTYADDLADVLGFLVSDGSRGIFHGTNYGPCTWHELAIEVATLMGLDPSVVVPCTTNEFPTPALRPACSILQSHNLEALGCESRPSWQDAVKRYFELLESGITEHP